MTKILKGFFGPAIAAIYGHTCTGECGGGIHVITKGRVNRGRI